MTGSIVGRLGFRFDPTQLDWKVIKLESDRLNQWSNWPTGRFPSDQQLIFLLFPHVAGISTIAWSIIPPASPHDTGNPTPQNTANPTIPLATPPSTGSPAPHSPTMLWKALPFRPKKVANLIVPSTAPPSAGTLSSSHAIKPRHPLPSMAHWKASPLPMAKSPPIKKYETSHSWAKTLWWSTCMHPSLWALNGKLGLSSFLFHNFFHGPPLDFS